MKRWIDNFSSFSIAARILRALRMDLIASACYKVAWRVFPFFFRITGTVPVADFIVSFRLFILSDWHITTPSFEKAAKTYFQPKLGETVVDVGAHIGLYTLMASKMLGTEGRVISVEPDASNLVMLRKNIALNNLNNVLVLPIALGDTNGQKAFYAGIMPTGSSLNPSDSRIRHKVRSTSTIGIMTLDSLLEKLGVNSVDWLKIDAENMDLEVLMGAEHLLRTSRGISIIIEASSKKTVDFLSNLGFRVKQIDSSYFIASKVGNA